MTKCHLQKPAGISSAVSILHSELRHQRISPATDSVNLCRRILDAKQDMPTFQPSVIFTPVRGSFPLLLLLRKPASCSVKESRVMVFVHVSGQSQHCLSHRSDRISLLPLALFSNCLHLCPWPACTRLLTATTLLLHWAISCCGWAVGEGEKKRQCLFYSCGLCLTYVSRSKETVSCLCRNKSIESKTAH